MTLLNIALHSQSTNTNDSLKLKILACKYIKRYFTASRILLI